MTRIDPGLNGAVVRPGDEAHLTEEGWVRPMKMTLSPEMFEQYRTGYRCPRCHSVQSTAFPEECETVWRDTGEKCGFRIKDEILAWLDFEFRGEETLWPERAEDEERKDWHERNGIWLPGDE